MQLSNNFYELYCYGSNFVYNNQFLANFEMSESLPFSMNMSLGLANTKKLKLKLKNLAKFKSYEVDGQDYTRKTGLSFISIVVPFHHYKHLAT